MLEKALEILFTQGPVVVVLVGVAVFMYKQFNKLIEQVRIDIDKRDITIKEKDAQIQKLNDEAREDNKENLKLLSEFSNLLDKVLTTTQNGQAHIIENINTSATSVKQHIDTKIEQLKNKTNGSG